ncbi:MAG: Rpn family recombination-promoting nuclease/putative transposase [Lachnospiraceae bacterium]|nr:Rpn family recombination-promoting nuclease/putative transposase [Lachnospiraceae bacterium]MDD7378336.1 Rpn family recombination-promoting nuclease/putative transposase [Lachnospiraceae bacterium]MDY4618122.1 Rpn family recombination-promoting nuclease/putative transposase [Lachnospiraceae bacterium]
MKKTLQELDLSNSFLFAAALEDPEICQLVLEIILGSKVPKVKVHAEHSILISSEFRSVRLDIYASDELQVNYNVEAQNENEGNLAKRSRYHQAEMDVSSLKPGDDFNDLKPGYVIFICTFDPFGEGLYRYTFEERCLERNIKLGDETRKIFLNTKGKNEKEVPKELIHFLKYVENSTDDYVSGIKDDSIERLHEKVTALKRWRGLEAKYMTFEELLKRRELKGKAEGITEGIAETVLTFLEVYGTVPEDVRERILSERHIEVLKNWTKLAAQVDSVEEFVSKMQEESAQI